MRQKKKIRVLLVDDSADDRELILMKLRRGGYEPDYVSVDTKEGFQKALDNHKWDLILCDYSMPGFDGITALEILNQLDRDIPFILISGAIGEELAVKAMKAGAHDYLMKDNLQRLVPAVKRELNEAENRKKHRKAQRERKRLLTVIQNSLNEVYIFNAGDLKFRYLNNAALENLGYSDDEISHLYAYDIDPQIDNRQQFNRIIQPLLDGKIEKEIYISKHIRKDGSIYPIEVHLQLVKEENEKFFAAIGFDMSDREKDAMRIREQKKIARELALHSQYKSEFLANMSHELRTPLNSIILLSKLLLKGADSNLTDDQVNYANVIHQSGNNLLELINEVLDLSKIEAGEMEISLSAVDTSELLDNIKSLFKPIADDKGVRFIVQKEKDVPDEIISDRMRLEQVLKNLLSNALKFTDSGSVALNLFNHREEENPMIGFKVTDSGIGIPDEKLALIFQSFRQVDGSTQRKYGGTGLGLTICRQISELLGGSISVSSNEGEGSIFTVILPADSTGKVKNAQNITAAIGPSKKGVKTMPANRAIKTPSVQKPHKKTASEKNKSRHNVLIATNQKGVRDDLSDTDSFNKFALSVAESGSEVVDMAGELNPSLVILDLYLADISGWTAAKMISDTFSSQNISILMLEHPDREIPELNLPFVKGILSHPPEEEKLADFLPEKKPNRVNREGKKTLLLIDDNEMHNTALQEFSADIVDRCLTAETAKEAFITLKKQIVHCIVLDLSLPDASGTDVLKKLSSDPELAHIPVIIYSGRSLSAQQKSELIEHASDVILKSVGSHAKLMNSISSLIGDKSSSKSQKTPNLSGKRILIVEDDKSSYFSLSSFLKTHDLTSIRASNGMEAIRQLESDSAIDAILMDVMMPDLDGFELLKKIRSEKKWKTLPIFSVTARAMKGDREKCLESGATDYVSKPVDPNKLLNLLTVWIG